MLAGVSLFQVTRELDEHARDRLSDAAKAHGIAIYDRLRSAEASLAMVAAMLESDPATREFAADPAERFDGLLLVADDGVPETLWGGSFSVPSPYRDVQEQLDSGGTVLTTSREDGPTPRVLMTMGMVSPDGARRRLVGAIRPAYLWGLEGLSPMTQLSVLDDTGRLLVPAASAPEAFLDELRERLSVSTSGRLEWSDDSEEYLSSFWSLFLRARFHVASWTIVLSEPLDYVQGPIGEFRSSFIWVTLMSIWVVLLLSLVQIRRTLVPLEALREGTRRIAARDFDARVTVSSSDEFQDLAESFNGMAGRLGKQFGALTTIHEIDRAVLSTLHTADVVDTALASMRALVPCDELCIGLRTADLEEFEVHARSARGQIAKSVHNLDVRSEDLERLRRADGYVLDRMSAGSRSYTRPLAMRGTTSFLTLPLGSAEALAGFVCFGQATARGFDAEDVQHVRQVCDQIAVALANAKLVGELDESGWGALRALARAIDAKSPWTAGHSERVTALALQIAAALGDAADVGHESLSAGEPVNAGERQACDDQREAAGRRDDQLDLPADRQVAQPPRFHRLSPRSRTIVASRSRFELILSPARSMASRLISKWIWLSRRVKLTMPPDAARSGTSVTIKIGRPAAVGGSGKPSSGLSGIRTST